MRIGVVGAGVMGRNHSRVVLSQGHELVGIVDSVPGAAAGVARERGTDPYPSLRALLAQARPDAVVVATPTDTHEEVAVEALEAGLHVLVEKPIAADPAAARRIAACAERAGRTLAVGHVERHNPVVAFAKRALDEQRFGQPITLSTRRVSSYPGRVRDVGCILDMGIHDIDVLNHLAGEAPDRVYGAGGRHIPDSSAEDHASIVLAFPSGLTGSVEVNWLTPRKVRRLWLTCDQAFVECDYMDQRVEISRTTFGSIEQGDLSRIPIETRSETLDLQREEPLARQLRDFVGAAEGARPPLADGAAGLLAVVVAHAALRSMETGRSEAVGPVEAPA